MPRRLTVPLADEDDTVLQRYVRKLECSEAVLTRTFLRYGIRHGPQAIAELMAEAEGEG